MRLAGGFFSLEVHFLSFLLCARGWGRGVGSKDSAGEKPRSLFSERSQYGRDVRQRKMRGRGQGVRQVQDEQGPGRCAPAHAMPTRPCRPRCPSPRGREMAAAAPDVTSGVETGRRRRNVDRWRAVACTWPPPAGRVARHKKGYGQSPNIICLHLRSGWEVTKVAIARKTFWG